MTGKLKSLELQGYKTFAQKVCLEFPRPITAIVGPNGSGKSNVADAIRWVLGEQSYSLLRGRKTMDMIFSGSDQKARAGMASVTISFQNEDGWLPIDYDEVALTRRAYRSGENEYQINGQRVRLKDINELLGQSGLAERTYTIIGQGLIDTALALKADERRRFFEEAAGIGLYRSRRDEAIGRLDATKRNLERISDILSELEPRMNSLARQAKRAKDHASLTAELKVLLRDWYGYHWHHAQQLLVAAIEGSEAQAKLTAEARSRQNEKEQQLVALQQAIKTSREKIAELHRALATFHNAKDQATREGAILSERLIAAERSIQQFAEESELNRVELAHQVERIEQAEAEMETYRVSLETALAEKERFSDELRKQQGELGSLRRALSEKRNANAAKENEKVRIKARSDEANARLRSLAESNRTLAESGAKAKSELDTGRKKVETATEMLSAHQAAFDQTAEERDALQQQIREHQQTRETVREGLAQLSATISRYKARLDVLNDAEANQVGVNQGTQFLIRQSKNYRGAIEAIGALFRFPEEIEAAAAAVLGEELDGVVADGDDWEAIGRDLRSADHGRARIRERIPTAHPLYETRNEILLDAGAFPLRESVGAEEPNRALAARFFDNAYLVPGTDAEDAFRKALSLRGALRPGEILVTSAGERIDADGVLVAGVNPKVALLSRKRELRELQVDLTCCHEEETEQKAQLESIAAQIAELETQLRTVSTERKRLGETLDADRKALNRYQIEVQKQEQYVAFQEQRIRENDEQREKLTSQIEQDRTAIQTIDTALETFRGEIRALQDAIHAIRLDEIQNQVQFWTIEASVTEKSIRDAQSRRQEAQSLVARSQARIDANEEKSASIAQEIAAINERREALKSDERRNDEEAGHIEAEIAPAEAHLAELERKLVEAQRESQLAQQRASASEKSLMMAQLEVSRLQDSLDGWKSKIEDDFGLVSFEYDERVIGQSTLPLGDLVSELPRVDELPEKLGDQITRMKAMIQRMGAINPEAIAEYEEVRERYEFLTTQLADVRSADKDLRDGIEELEEMMRTSFRETFEKVQGEFKELFTRLFGGGSARLALTDPDDLNDSGIDIQAKLPGKRDQELSLLSGGERALTSVALVFALLKVSPTPFCVFDEVDASLDEANVGRFCELLKELSSEIQFVVITHNRNTVEIADVIYGVTMSRESVSQVVSLRLDDVEEEYLKREG